MPFITIPSADVDQGSVVDESLMSGKIKNDLDDLNARVVSLEALSGAGGVAAAAVEDLFADIVAGGEDNIAKFWKVRHHPMMNTTGVGNTPEGIDLEERDVYERFFHDPNFTAVSSTVSGANYYLGNVYYIEQNEQLQFRIKKGENFFCLGIGYMGTTAASQFQVLIDGVNANTYGLVDENDVAVATNLSANNATTIYGKMYWFFGLDGEEHIVTIKNTNASALEVPLNYVDVGYRSPEYALDHTLRVRAGAANVGGIAAQFAEGNFTFAKPGIGLGNGHTGMIKINQSGTLTAIDGLSPASTQCKPRVAIPFSGGPVTSLSVKNHWYFPDNGICMFCHPSGENYFFSYSSKAQPGGPASQTLNGIVWQVQPKEDFTPLPDVAALTVNLWRGDARIEYWAKPPIFIDGSNNKVDFEISINGVITSHTATLTGGYFAADIVRIGKNFVDAMKAAKPLPAGHEYFCEYNSRSQLWSIGVRGDQIEYITFKWATGANSATDFGVVLGFTSDSTSAKTYLSPVVKQHLARRVFVADDNRRDSEHPSVKYAWDAGGNVPIAEADQIIQVNSLSGYRRQADTSRIMYHIYPDEDACGMALMHMREDLGSYVTYQIDDGDVVFLCTTQRPLDSASPNKGALIHSFISFPKGSRKITLRIEYNIWFDIDSTANTHTFFGYRQYYTKPQWEMLAPTEKILKCIEVNPIRLFATPYGHNTALYTPQPTNDNINAITESGVWTQVVGTSYWNQRYRQTVVAGAYVDITFVLSGDGGGIGVRRLNFTTSTRRAEFFLASGGVITEGTDLVDFISTDALGNEYKMDFQHMGLPAGTYTLRMKQLDTQALVNNGIIVYDTVLPQTVNGVPGPRTLTDVANTGQGVSYPINVRRREMSRYQTLRQPTYYPEGTYKRGVVHHGDFLTAALTIINREETTDVIEEADTWWSTAQLATNAGEYFGYRTFCRSLSAQVAQFSTYSTVIQPALDGRNLNTVSAAAQVKGGLAPSATRYDSQPIVFNNFESAVTFSAGLTYNMVDTRGLRTGQKVVLTDGTNFEEAFIASFVTDTSFTIAKALSVLTDSAVNKVFFWGFHNLKMTSGDAVDWYMNAFVFEPLPLEESYLPNRVQTETREEILFTNATMAAVAAGGAGVRVSQRIPFPIHSDGEEGNFFTMQFFNETSALNVDFSNGTGSYINLFLRAAISAAATALAAFNAQIVSRKWVKKFTDLRVKG